VAVTDAKREREHLAEANRHVAQAQKHIANQKKQIEKLERDGHEIDMAVSMLRALEHALRGFERHRDLVLKRIKNHE
jgi:septal ring factor EnvC (AmiA/AmiB activator)